MWKTYTKKPIAIQAIQLPNLYNPTSILDELIHTRILQGTRDAENDIDCWLVKTPEGDMLAHENDYLILGTHGEYYPVKQEIFEANYFEGSTELNENVFDYPKLREAGESIIEVIKNDFSKIGPRLLEKRLKLVLNELIPDQEKRND